MRLGRSYSVTVRCRSGHWTWTWRAWPWDRPKCKSSDELEIIPIGEVGFVRTHTEITYKGAIDLFGDSIEVSESSSNDNSSAFFALGVGFLYKYSDTSNLALTTRIRITDDATFYTVAFALVLPK